MNQSICLVGSDLHYYTGIGSRETPLEIQSLMRKVSEALFLSGYTMRSGGADGADTAFQLGSDRNEIYIPWNDFNGNFHDGSGIIRWSSLPNQLRDLAQDIAKEIHPNWNSLSRAGKTLHSRNIFQILGKDLDTPSEFVIYWSPVDGRTGSPIGGTRTAVKLAELCKIPSFNLLFPDHREIFEDFVKSKDVSDITKFI